MSEWKFRLAEPSDAEAFAHWTANNKMVDSKDVATANNNPTTLYFVIENDKGEPVVFAPFYTQMVLAYLGFNPEMDAESRKKALQMMLDGTVAWAIQFGMREITTLTKEGYPVAKWAMEHGFDVEPRQTLRFDINKLLKSEDDQTCAAAPVETKL